MYRIMASCMTVTGSDHMLHIIRVEFNAEIQKTGQRQTYNKLAYTHCTRNLTQKNKIK